MFDIATSRTSFWSFIEVFIFHPTAITSRSATTAIPKINTAIITSIKVNPLSWDILSSFGFMFLFGDTSKTLIGDVNY